MRAWVLGIVASCALGLLYPLNMAFYTGSTIGNWIWRLEHGRLQIRHALGAGEESFYVAINSEPLQFGLEGNWFSLSNWSMCIPIWVPLLFVVAATLGAQALRKTPGAQS